MPGVPPVQLCPGRCPVWWGCSKSSMCFIQEVGYLEKQLFETHLRCRMSSGTPMDWYLGIRTSGAFPDDGGNKVINTIVFIYNTPRRWGHRDSGGFGAQSNVADQCFFFWRTIAKMHYQKSSSEQVVLKKEATWTKCRHDAFKGFIPVAKSATWRARCD